MTKDNRKLPFFLIVVFLALFLIGINTGDVPVVLEKATRICLSCIGIG
jgi:hypothetical protein